MFPDTKLASMGKFHRAVPDRNSKDILGVKAVFITEIHN